MPASVHIFRLDLEAAAICALAHVRQASGTSGLFSGHILSVLDHRYGLEVICLVERTVDGPVVRNGNLLPAFCSLDVMAFAELPFLQKSL